MEGSEHILLDMVLRMASISLFVVGIRGSSAQRIY
jgi:hypothetical protein